MVPKIVGFDTTDAKSIAEATTVLDKLILPWSKDTASPPRWERLTGTGRRLGFVDGWLGGYGDPHRADEVGWGYTSQVGSSCVRGIASTREEAFAIVDDFLKDFGEYTLLCYELAPA